MFKLNLSYPSVWSLNCYCCSLPWKNHISKMMHCFISMCKVLYDTLWNEPEKYKYLKVLQKVYGDGPTLWYNTLSCHIQTLASHYQSAHLNALLLIYLFANLPRKVMSNGSNPWGLPPMWEIQMEFLAFNFSLAQPWAVAAISGSKSVDEKSLSLAEILPFQ